MHNVTFHYKYHLIKYPVYEANLFPERGKNNKISLLRSCGAAESNLILKIWFFRIESNSEIRTFDNPCM